MANVSDLTKLPAPAGALPELPAKTVKLYKDARWNSESWTISLDNTAEGRRHPVADSMWDQATWVAFNMPVGKVVTLSDNIVPLRDGQNIADLSGCGISVDLVGTGRTEAVDLNAVGMNDLVSMYSLRTVDLDLGAIELFENRDFTGNRNILFLSDWNQGQVHSIANWWLNDKVSSARWKTLDRQTASLFEHGDGAGNSYDNILGYGDAKECPNLGVYRLEDQMSAFRWDGIVPKKEIIKPFEVKVPAGNMQAGLVQTDPMSNGTDLDQPGQQVKFTKEFHKTFSVSTTEKAVTGVKVTGGYKAGSAGGGEIMVELSYSYEASKTTSQTYTEVTKIEETRTITIPRRSRIEAQLGYFLGELPPTEYKTTAERWYDRRLTGTVQDGDLYKRVEPVRVTLVGALKAIGTLDIKQYPL